jgi:Protein of unknown function (DUF3574)
MNKFGFKQILTMVLLPAFWLAPVAFAERRFTPNFAGNIFVAKSFLRTELYFGTMKTDGTPVTEDEWQKFLAEEVTPRFPDGFTVLTGYGQFRDSGGKIVRENSFVLILLYPWKMRKSSSRKIEQIRRAYKKTFQQQSVMRVDYQQAARVSF